MCDVIIIRKLKVKLKREKKKNLKRKNGLFSTLSVKKPRLLLWTYTSGELGELWRLSQEYAIIWIFDSNLFLSFEKKQKSLCTCENWPGWDQRVPHEKQMRLYAMLQKEGHLIYLRSYSLVSFPLVWFSCVSPTKVRGKGTNEGNLNDIYERHL